MSYRVLTVALDNVLTDRIELVPPGQTITEIDILDMPDGVEIQLALGDGQLFTVPRPITFEPRGEEDQNRGLFWANPVSHPGLTIEIIVSSGGASGGRIS